MTYGLSFSEEFFYGQEEPSSRPTSVQQAIVSLAENVREEIAEAVFGVDAETLDPWLVMEQIRQTNTCSNLDSPVEVWIDRDGFHTLLVYDPE